MIRYKKIVKSNENFIVQKQKENEITELLKTIKDKLKILERIIDMDRSKKKMAENELKKREKYVQKLSKIGKRMEDAFVEKEEGEPDETRSTSSTWPDAPSEWRSANWENKKVSDLWLWKCGWVDWKTRSCRGKKISGKTWRTPSAEWWAGGMSRSGSKTRNWTTSICCWTKSRRWGRARQGNGGDQHQHGPGQVGSRQNGARCQKGCRKCDFDFWNSKQAVDGGFGEVQVESHLGLPGSSAWTAVCWCCSLG